MNFYFTVCSFLSLLVFTIADSQSLHFKSRGKKFSSWLQSQRFPFDPMILKSKTLLGLPSVSCSNQLVLIKHKATQISFHHARSAAAAMLYDLDQRYSELSCKFSLHRHSSSRRAFAHFNDHHYYVMCGFNINKHIPTKQYNIKLI